MLTMQAATLSYDFTSGSSTSSTSSGTTFGNVRTFTVNGVTITVTAWSLTGNSGTTFQTGNLGRWPTGLGDCNQIEGTDCASPEHQVDNNGNYDFVLFQFSAPVSSISVVISPYGTYDRDVTYYTGNASSSLDLTGDSLSSLSGLGFGSAINDDSTVSSNPRTVTVTSGDITSLLFGARVGGDSYSDYFKITSMCLQPSAVPEPATFGTLGLALILLGVIGRIKRRRSLS